ncbi:MAG: hypothetical protein QM820_59285 [Minicystis sp.]
MNGTRRAGPFRPGGEHLILIAALLPAIGLAAAFWGYTLDDSFITFRYAKNLAAGLGPVFNAEGPHAEGSTGFLWVLVMALPHLVGMDALLFAKLAGFAALATSAAAAGAIGYQLTEGRDPPARRSVAATAAAIVATIPVLHVSAVSGMETALFTAATTAFFAAQVAFARQPGPRFAAAIAALALTMGLTRPEGNLVAGAGIAASLLLAAPADRRALLTRSLALFVVPGALFFAWRYRYYGHPFPLSFYLKVAGQGGFAGLGSVISFVGWIAVHLGLPLLFGVVALTADDPARRRAAPPIVAALALVAFMTRPAHIMGENHRFLVPITPLAAAVAALGLGAIEAAIAASTPRRLPVMLVRYGAVALIAASFLVRARPFLDSARAYGTGLRTAHMALGKRLARWSGNQGRAPLLAIADAGAVPYYSGWRAIDTFGLNDVHIALAHDHAPAYVLDQGPDVIVLLSRSGRAYEPMIGWEKDLYDAARARGLAEVKTLAFAPDSYHLLVLAVPGSPIGEDLRSWR